MLVEIAKVEVKGIVIAVGNPRRCSVDESVEGFGALDRPSVSRTIATLRLSRKRMQDYQARLRTMPDACLEEAPERRVGAKNRPSREVRL